MSGKNIFWWQKDKKKNTCKNKTVNTIENIDVNNILVCKKQPYGNKNLVKYFIGYNDNDIRPLCIRLPEMTGKNYTKIWQTIEKLMKINFESNLVYGDDVKYIKTNKNVCRQCNREFL